MNRKNNKGKAENEMAAHIDDIIKESDPALLGQAASIFNRSTFAEAIKKISWSYANPNNLIN